MPHADDNQSSKHQKKAGKKGQDKGKNMLRILLAEDDFEMRALLSETLRSAGYEVIMCRDGWGLLEELSDSLLSGSMVEDVDLVISDIRMPGVTGLEIVEGMRSINQSLPIILITAFGDRATHDRAKQHGVTAIFDKPFDMDELLAKIQDIASCADLR